MTCTSCQREIADNSSFCPFCGTAQPAAPSVQGGPAPTSLPGSTLPPATPAMPAAPMAPVPPPAAGFPPAAPAPAGAWSGSTPGVGAGGPPLDQGKATMALMLAIGGIILDLGGCCCFGVPALAGIGLGVAAFIMGRNELEDIAGGFVSQESQGMANGAKIAGIVAIVLGVLSFFGGIALALFGALGGAQN
ncbi:MAG TPA: zinc ribbon domain-containing protein [bacterium]|nr:zinc ribbon domain-containing protein [bacterium]